MSTYLERILEEGIVTAEEMKLLDQVYNEMFLVCTRYEGELIKGIYIDELLHELNEIVQKYHLLLLQPSDSSTPTLKTLLYNYFSHKYSFQDTILAAPVEWLSTHYNETFSDDVEKFVNGKGRLKTSKFLIWSFYKVNDPDSNANILSNLSRKGLEFCINFIEGIVGRSLNVKELEIYMSILFSTTICYEDKETDTLLLPDDYLEEVFSYRICIDAGINRYKTYQRKLVGSEKMREIVQNNIQDLSIEQCETFLEIAGQGFKEEWILDTIKANYIKINNMNNGIDELFNDKRPTKQSKKLVI